MAASFCSFSKIFIYKAMQLKDVPHKAALKVQLYLETLFIDLAEKNFDFQIVMTKSYIGIGFEITYIGKNYDPYEAASDNDFLHQMKTAINIKVQHSYLGGQNTLKGSYAIPFKIRPSSILIWSVIAVIIGFSAKHFFPANAETINTDNNFISLTGVNFRKFGHNISHLYWRNYVVYFIYRLHFYKNRKAMAIFVAVGNEACTGWIFNCLILGG